MHLELSQHLDFENSNYTKMMNAWHQAERARGGDSCCDYFNEENLPYEQFNGVEWITGSQKWYQSGTFFLMSAFFFMNPVVRCIILGVTHTQHYQFEKLCGDISTSETSK